MTIGLRAAALSALALLAGCREKVLPEPDFERMDRQEKCALWDPCEPLPEGRTAQHPPEGTVPVDGPSGVTVSPDAAEIPIPVTVPLLERGRQRFETLCAPCHGILGDGNSRVAVNMTLRPPPSLIGAKARGFPPGRIYQVITNGYGLMPRFSAELAGADERWAVIAYLRALELSRGVDVRALPPDLRARAEQELRSP